MGYAVRVCYFSGEHFDALTTKQRRDYQVVKEAVLADGRFSAFDASSSAPTARIFDRLASDPSIETFAIGYPWVGVRRAPEETPS